MHHLTFVVVWWVPRWIKNFNVVTTFEAFPFARMMKLRCVLRLLACRWNSRLFWLDHTGTLQRSTVRQSHPSLSKEVRRSYRTNHSWESQWKYRSHRHPSIQGKRRGDGKDRHSFSRLFRYKSRNWNWIGIDDEFSNVGANRRALAKANIPKKVSNKQPWKHPRRSINRPREKECARASALLFESVCYSFVLYWCVRDRRRDKNTNTTTRRIKIKDIHVCLSLPACLCSSVGWTAVVVLRLSRTLAPSVIVDSRWMNASLTLDNNNRILFLIHLIIRLVAR